MKICVIKNRVFRKGIIGIFSIVILSFAPKNLKAQYNSYLESINGLSFKMIFVEGGSFRMGCYSGREDDCWEREFPVHRVTVSDYHIGETEVTVGQFRVFVEETGYRTTAERKGRGLIWNGIELEAKVGVCWRHDAYGTERPESDSLRPVLHVSWDDATAFCDWLSEKTKKKYRLPTEAEWEFAARGGKRGQNRLYSGSDDLDQVAWYEKNAPGGPQSVKTKQANELGLYDMSGNVWEWCQDWYGDYPMAPQIDPVGPPAGSYRVRRGGGWNYEAQLCRVSFRNFVTSDYSHDALGFRVVSQ